MPLIEYSTQINRTLAGSPLDPAEFYDKTASDARYAPISNSAGVFSVLDYGAAADGLTDDLAAFRAAMAACSAAGGGVVLVPPGDYALSVGVALATQYIDVPANCTVRMHGATITATAISGQTGYYVFRISGSTTTNVTLDGGALILDRTSGDLSGETGFGVAIRSGANDVRVLDMTITDSFGDAVYLGGSTPVANVEIRGCKLRNCRRNNLSIVHAAGVLVADCEFTDANGTSPQAGVDIEPNEGYTITDVQIVNCYTTGNAGSGLNIISGVAGRTAGVAATRRIAVANCVGIDNTGWAINIGSVDEITVTGCVANGNIGGIAATDIRQGTIANCVAKANDGYGIYVESALSVAVSGNSAHGNGSDGFRMRGDAAGGDVAFERCTVTGNTASGNTQRGLYIMNAIGCTVAANVAAENGYDGMRFDNCLHNAISGNLSAGNGSAAASTYYGIILAASSDNMVRGNVIRYSTRYLSATATAGSSTTITFPAAGNVSALDDWYNGLEIEITSGTGSGQTRTISDYVGSTRVATVSVDWTTNPDATSVFEVRNVTRIYRSLYFNSTSNRNWYVDNDCRYAAAILDSGTGNVTTAGNLAS